jgi:class 3 adenylate cyclase/tetratricopeptide (TPR) repeat protein
LVICSTCGTENAPGQKFCGECGAGLVSGCPTCGATNPPGHKFCGECGTALAASEAAAARPASGPDPAVRALVAERRLVSVLFADLVGFTPFAEERDAEEVRDTLSRYFELAREVIDRYGGTVEKFIGDAVMAIWGAPVAREDDTERAVRASLDLVASVSRLAAETGLSNLQLRAGVTTGEAAVTIGASGQGMVAGDLVNTASRLQAIAPPGTVLVGEATYRAANSAISFEPAGEQLLRGKTAPVPAWRALSVVAMVGGANRADTIEPPFVGRDADFGVLKELLHATGRERRARLVSIVGVAGIGKSRLAWELEKYIDGLVEVIYWHHGRSPAYGEGIAFWSLGEMVRRRAGIAETDDEAQTAARLDSCLLEYVPDEEERRWIGPRLRALLGLEAGPTGEREELFAAWRAFFERVADRGTTVLVFEDLHWADPGLLDFIESLLEWSRARPILIVTLARPELLDRRPTWGASQRHCTGIHLEPLSTAAMTELVTGLAPGLSGPIVSRIVERSEGIPLYAVETFRMLVDRGQLAARDGRFEVVGDLPSLDVPTSLQSLIGARLDALGPSERTLLQDAAVLGQSFTMAALAGVTGQPAADLEGRLRLLVGRELLSTVADPRSPERGQYGFVQSLIREVAYGTLSRRDRRARHLAAARYFESLGDDEIAGVLASHYLEAFRSSPAGPEADAVAAQARIALRGAAQRALALRSPDQALTYLEQALQVTVDETEQARLHEEAARAAEVAAQAQRAEEHVRRALDSYGERGDPAAIARATALLGGILLMQSRIDPAAAALEAALEGLADADRDPTGVELMGQLARAEMFRAQPHRALEWAERGFEAAARLDLVPAIAELLVTRAWALEELGRVRESLAVSQGAIEMSREHGLPLTEIRARNNLGSRLASYEPRRSLEILGPAYELAERLGHREWVAKLGFRAWVAFEAGDWDLAAAIVGDQLRDDLPLISWLPLVATEAVLGAWRHDPRQPTGGIDRLRERTTAGATAQDWSAVHWTECHVALAAGQLQDARRSAQALQAAGQAIGDIANPSWMAGIVASWQGDEAGVREALAVLEPVPAVFRSIPGMRAHLGGVRAAMAGRRGEAASHFVEAADAFRRAGSAWCLAMCLADAATYLGADDPIGRGSLEEVRVLATGWGASVLLERIDERIGRGRPRRDRASVVRAEVADPLLEPSER